MEQRESFETILTTRLHPPPISSDIVARPRLLKTLMEGRRRTMTLISAPAGYGKSVLASQWLAGEKCPGAWVSLDEDDGDPRTFLAYVLAAIQNTFPEAELKTQPLLQAAEMPPPKVLARHLLNDMERIGEEFILVLDDYHHITESSIHDLIVEMLRHPSPNMHLAVLTRRDPPFPIHALRAGGEMTEIGVQQLRFTPAETREFLDRLVRIDIDEDTAALLEERLEGWASGLRLVAITMAETGEYDRMIEVIRDGSHYLQEYLLREVLSHVSRPISDYLRYTSLLDRFCAPLCEAVRPTREDPGGDPAALSGHDFIEWLERTHLFVIPLDSRHEWFRYHHLFQQLLKRELEKASEPGEIEAAHLRAGAWFAENGRIEEGIRHLLAGGDVDAAAGLVEKNRIAVINTDSWQVFRKWLSLFPEEEIQRRIGLLLARLWLHTELYEVQELLGLLRSIEPLTCDLPPGDPLRAEVDHFRGYVAYILNDGAESLKHLEDARRAMPDTHHEIKGQTEMLWGMASQMQGEKDKAVGELRDIILKENPHPIRVTRLLAGLSFMHTIAGELEEAAEVSREFEEISAKHGYDFARAWAVYMRGCTSFYRNELGFAIGHLNESSELRHISHNRAAVDGMAGLVLAYEAAGHPDRADRALRDLSEHSDGLRDSSYSVIAASCGARLSIMRGETEAALSCLQGGAPPVENMVFWMEVPCLTYCRALLSEGSDSSLKEAEKRLEECLKLNQDSHNVCNSICVMTLLAMAYDGLDRLDDALAMLERAVIAADPGGIVRPFAEIGPPVIELLNILIEQGKSVEPVERLLASLDRPQPAVPEEIAHAAVRRSGTEQSSGSKRQAPHGEPVPELTRRELEILNLLGEGLRNQEIADRLFISTETVKSHVYNLFQKLEVKGRVRAVKRA
ncbi:MAG: LuxR C-terminal-related transcriptional regulator, partial [bacterium]